MTRGLRIATRGSDLALRRARQVPAMLESRGTSAEMVTFRTSGDKHFDETGPQGAFRAPFTRELDEAVLKKKADLAVHALSDVPVDTLAGMTSAAVLPRYDQRDALVLRDRVEAAMIEELPRGTRIGTSSLRCRALL